MFKASVLLLISCMLFLWSPSFSHAQVIREIILKEHQTRLDQEMLGIAQKMSHECQKILEASLDHNIISKEELFTTLYFPEIPLNSPPTFVTFYTRYIENFIRPIENKYLKMNPKIVFAVLIDANGYVSAHNTKYSQPRTGNPELDLKQNRTRRIFNDLTGFSAAVNKNPYLLQIYSRDTGEIFADLSVPVFVKGQHWGAVRIGYAR